jgi:hypothetical protein
MALKSALIGLVAIALASQALICAQHSGERLEPRKDLAEHLDVLSIPKQTATR